MKKQAQNPLLSDNAVPEVVEKFINTLEEKILRDGFAVLDNPIPSAWLESLEQVFKNQSQAFKKSLMGKDQKIENDNLRGDWTLWLDESADLPVFNMLRRLQSELNQRLFWGLRRFECHLAFYPPGKGYERHIDNPRGAKERQLTFLAYMNRDWRPEFGGELEIFSRDPTKSHETVLKISPVWNRWVFFLSEEFPHQVCKSSQNRQSLSGWFRHD